MYRLNARSRQRGVQACAQLYFSRQTSPETSDIETRHYTQTCGVTSTQTAKSTNMKVLLTSNIQLKNRSQQNRDAQVGVTRNSSRSVGSTSSAHIDAILTTRNAAEHPFVASDRSTHRIERLAKTKKNHRGINNVSLVRRRFKLLYR